MGVAYVIIVACCIQIVAHMRFDLAWVPQRMLYSIHTRSSRALRLQSQLFRCLVWQTIVPLVTAYAPAGASMILPFFGEMFISSLLFFENSSVFFTGLSIPIIAVISPLFCAIHPLFDAVVIIVTVTEYR